MQNIILHIDAYICKIYMQNMQNNMQKIVQGSYSAYYAFCNMQNMQYMANNMLQYA